MGSHDLSVPSLSRTLSEQTHTSEPFINLAVCYFAFLFFMICSCIFFASALKYRDDLRDNLCMAIKINIVDIELEVHIVL